MDILLTLVEARVLGALIEKEITTPEYYPLTLNALVNACNQKSNREPVMNLDEKNVVRAILGLRDKHLLWEKNPAGSRVPKYAQRLDTTIQFSPQERAVICLLLLRGAQTAGELRSRSGRLCEFSDLKEVELTLQHLIEREKGPFIVKLPRQAGRKENRYMHLFCGEIEICDEETVIVPEPARLEVLEENRRIEEIEKKIIELEEAHQKLIKQFNKFVEEFE